MDVLFPKRDPPVSRINKIQQKPLNNNANTAVEEKNQIFSMNEIKETIVSVIKNSGTDQNIPIDIESTTTTTTNKIEENNNLDKKNAPKKEKPLSQFPVQGYSDEENMW